MQSLQRRIKSVDAEWIEYVMRTSETRVIDDEELKLHLAQDLLDVGAIVNRLQYISRAVVDPTLPTYRPILTEEARKLHQLKRAAAQKLLVIRSDMIESEELALRAARSKDAEVWQSMRAKVAG